MRTRIVTAITVVAALGLVAVGASVYLVERARILEQIDDRLEANLESARYIVAQGDPETGGWESSVRALAAVVQRMSPDDNTGAVGTADGKITTIPGVELDVDLQRESTFAAYVDRQLASRGEPIIGTYADEGVVWRYLAAPIRVDGSPDPAEVVFILVYDVEAELDEIQTSGRAFIIASIITLLVIVATATIVATRLLRPLRHMRETAERISAQSLDERLPIVGNDDVADLSETMNDMLDRLDRALDSQRQLLSDVGHELKTPLTIVRGHLEVMDLNDPEDVRGTQQLAIDELDRMGRLVQDLADAAALHGAAPVHPIPTDIAPLVESIARKATGIVGAEISLSDVPAGFALVDEARITQAMLQLAQNAVTHGGGRLEIGGTSYARAVSFWVRDFGPGVADEEKERIFERFHRGVADEERVGSGLGLSIVRVIAEAHGGSVSVQDAPGGGAIFVITVPRADVSPVATPPRPRPPASPMTPQEN